MLIGPIMTFVAVAVIGVITVPLDILPNDELENN